MRSLHRATITKAPTRIDDPGFAASLWRETIWRRTGIVVTVSLQILVAVASVVSIGFGIVAANVIIGLCLIILGAFGIVAIGVVCHDVEQQLSRLNSVNEQRRRLQQLSGG